MSRHLLSLASTGLMATGNLSAQTTNELPQLVPPYPEVPPGFWEQHGLAVFIGALITLVAIAIIVWLILRPRPAAILPPEVKARRALAALLGQPETDKTLSAASQILRRYFTDAFELGVGEATTKELVSAIEKHPRIPPPLRQAVAEFLTDCDTRKFAMARLATPTGSIPRVLQLIDQAEASRTAQTIQK